MGAIKREVVIGDCRLILGDCREIAPVIEGVDAVVTDPPYGISINTKIAPRAKRHHRGFARDHLTYGKAYAPIIGDDEPFDPTPWLAYPRSILWGAHHFADRLPKGQWLVWDKRCGIVPSIDHADGEVAWHSKPGALRIHRQLWSGMVREGDHFRSGQASSGRKHPTEKPVRLMSWCLELCKPQGIVFDPFMGSGPTGVAAVLAGHPFVGIEIVEEYFEIACERIAEAYRQPDMIAEMRAAPVQLSILDGAA